MKKRCPFCKSGNICLQSNGWAKDGSATGPLFWMGCAVCGADGPKAHSEEAARMKWNDREKKEGV